MRATFRHRILPLLLAGSLVWLGSLYFYETGTTLNEDKWIALGFTVGWTLITIQTLMATTRWGLADLGLLVLAIGMILFFGSFVVLLWRVPDPGPWLDATYRGSFAVALVFLIPASILWFADRLWAWRKRRKDRHATRTLEEHR